MEGGVNRATFPISMFLFPGMRQMLSLAMIFCCLGPSWTFATPEANNEPRDLDKNGGFSHEVVTLLTVDDSGEPLRLPSALFFDSRADELYLLFGGNRVVVYGPDYFPQDSLGKGRGVDLPMDGVFTPDGNILIPQRGGAGHAPRLTIINSAFLPVKEIDLAGVPEIGDFSPEHIALGREGNILLTGQNSSRVLELSGDFNFLRWLTVPVSIGGKYLAQGADAKSKMTFIRDVAVDSLGNIFLLSEETSKTYVFAPGGSYLFAFGTKGGAEGKLSRPRALAIDEKKRCIYVVDYMRHTVLLYDFTGAFRYEFGGLGWGPGWFNYPVDIVVGRQGQVIVADFFNQRAQVFTVKCPELPERPQSLWQGGVQSEGVEKKP